MIIYTCAWKRPEIFSLFVTHLPQYPLAVCGQQSDPCYEILQQYRPDAIWIESENQPLGRKFNNGLQGLKDVDFTHLFITGSDDIFSKGLFNYYETLKGKYHYVGLLDFYFTDFARTRYNPGFQAERKGEPHGAGRMLERQVIEVLDWTLWDDGINSGLDLSMTKRLQQVQGLQSHFFRCNDIGEIAIDVKGGQNIQSMQDYPGEWLKEDILGKVLKSDVVKMVSL